MFYDGTSLVARVNEEVLTITVKTTNLWPCHAVKTLADDLTLALERSPHTARIVLDMGNVKVISSLAVGQLLLLRRNATQRKSSLTILNLNNEPYHFIKERCLEKVLNAAKARFNADISCKNSDHRDHEAVDGEQLIPPQASDDNQPTVCVADWRSRGIPGLLR